MTRTVSTMTVTMMVVVVAITMLSVESMTEEFIMSKSMLSKAVIDAMLTVFPMVFSDTMWISIKAMAIVKAVRMVLLKAEWMVAFKSMWSVVVVHRSMMRWSFMMARVGIKCVLQLVMNRWLVLCLNKIVGMLFGRDQRTAPRVAFCAAPS